MPAPPNRPNSVRFGVFVFDRDTGDLWNGRYQARLQEQARVVLRALTDRPGELVTRDDLRRLLWGDDTFVEVDTALNVIVNRLRQALGDSASSPRFIETVPRKGYRFIASPGAAIDVAGQPPPRAPHRTTFRNVALACAIFAGAGAAVALAVITGNTQPHVPLRAVLPAPTGTTLGRSQLALSADASHVAVRTIEDGAAYLTISSLATGEATRVPQSTDATDPAFSPDGRRLAFCASGALHAVDLQSMQVSQPLNDGTCAGGFHEGGLAWNERGAFLYGSDGSIRLWHEGADRSVIVLEGDPMGVTFSLPEWLPDGRHFLVCGRAADEARTGIYVADAETRTSRFLVAAVAAARYAGSDVLVYAGGRGRILARRFDARTLTFASEPVPLAGGARAFAVSGNTLVYLDDTQSTTLVWMSRDGHRIENVASGSRFNSPRLSPDASTVAYGLSSNGDQRGIWLQNLETRNAMRLSAGEDYDPVWSIDGTRILYDRAVTSLVTRSSTGDPAESELLRRPNVFPTDWSPDGRYIAFNSGTPSRISIVAYGPGGSETELPVPAGRESYDARFSPDGRWIAYTSEEGGRPDVYVTSFPGFARKVKVSIDGGAQSVWRRDGRELFFVAPDYHVMSVDVARHRSDIVFGRPVPLFVAPMAFLTWPSFDAAPDGRRFLINAPAGSPPVMHVLSNWRSLLPQP